MSESVDPFTVKRDLLIAFEYSYLHDDWVTPLEEALDGVTAAEAAWNPGPDIPSIWQIVLHMTAWTDNIVQRMAQRRRGMPPGRPAEGAWPPCPAVQDEPAWETAKAGLWDALARLRADLEATPLADQLDHGTWGYSQLADLLCRFSHNAYHIGQITKLRQWWAMCGYS